MPARPSWSSRSVVDRLAELPEVAAADGSSTASAAYLLGKDGKLVGGTGAPTLAFNYYDSVNAAGDPILILESGEWPDQPGQINLDVSSAERGGYEVGDEVTLLLPTGELRPDVRARRHRPASTAVAPPAPPSRCSTPATAQDLFLDGEDAFTTVSLTAAEGVSQTELADAAKPSCPTASPPSRRQEVDRRVQTSRSASSSTSSALPDRLRGDRDRRGRLHHLQHLLDPGLAARPRVGAAAGARAPAAARSPGQSSSRLS